MKRKSVYSFLKKSLLSFLLLFTLLGYSSNAQQACVTTRPFMWGPKQDGLDEVAIFKRTKLIEIADKLHISQTNRFYLGNFFGMLDYFYSTYKSFYFLHVYIGVCNGSASTPAGYKNKLILIFAPASDDIASADMAYYIIGNKPFDPKGAASFQIAPKEKADWTTKFVNIKPFKTIDVNDPDNKYPDPTAPNPVTSETRCVTYCVGDLLGLIAVKNSCAMPYSISDNAIGYLGAYSNTGIPPIPGVPPGTLVGRYKNRINIHFEFLDKKDQEFYLDDIPGFIKLPQTPSTCPHPILDNGQLCPTHCP